MALTKTIDLRNGLTAKDAYIRVDAFYGSKSSISYSVNVYLSEAAFRGTEVAPPQPYLEQEVLEMEPDSSPGAPRLWEQLYEHLKAQERFVGAVDA